MDLKEVVALRDHLSELEARRSKVITDTQALVQNARAFVCSLSPVDTELEAKGERPQHQTTSQVVVHKEGDKVICGTVEVRNFTPAGEVYPFDGTVTIRFFEGILTDASDDDFEGNITISGHALSRGEEDGQDVESFAYEYAPEGSVIGDVLSLPYSSTIEGASTYQEYEPKLERAETLVNSMTSSLETIARAAQDTSLNP